MMDWHVVAGCFIGLAFLAALGFAALTVGLFGEVPTWVSVLTATLAVACVLAIPFLCGYVATGGPTAGPRGIL